jgi:tRNA-dihydrouridine synthase B
MIKTKNRLWLAPLDNINCISFRLLCKENGAGLVSTPMYNTHSYMSGTCKFSSHAEERPLLIQFIGSEPSEFKECVLNLKNCDIVDLNAGCPSPDQCKNKSGAALLKDLNLLEKIVKIMVKYSPVPVSVKIRMGWESDDSVRISKLVEKSGASFITVHPRTRFQGYGVPADWNVIRKVRESVKIPVIGSGDLLNPQSIKYCLDTTNCYAVMIARGAINDPFIFKDALHYLKNEEVLEHSNNERLELIERFIKLYKKYDEYNLSELRNHCAWLVKGIRGARKLRDAIGKTKTEEEILKSVNDKKDL